MILIVNLGAVAEKTWICGFVKFSNPFRCLHRFSVDSVASLSIVSDRRKHISFVERPLGRQCRLLFLSYQLQNVHLKFQAWESSYIDSTFSVLTAPEPRMKKNEYEKVFHLTVAQMLSPSGPPIGQLIECYQTVRVSQ